MATLPPLSPRGHAHFRVAATVLHCLALAATGFRATQQWRRRFSWDDACALVAATANAVDLAGLWVRASIDDQASKGQDVPVRFSRQIYMMVSLSYDCVLWTARISIACSILRLLPPRVLCRFVRSMICSFVLVWVALMTVKCCVCIVDRKWRFECPLGNPFIIISLIAGIFATFLLVVIPLWLLRNSRLPTAPKWMVRAVFGVNSLTVIISAIHASYNLLPDDTIAGFAAHFEGAILVIVCNLLVLVTSCYRTFRNHNLDDALPESLTTPVPLRSIVPDPDTPTSCFASYTCTQLSQTRGTSIFRDSIVAEEDKGAA